MGIFGEALHGHVGYYKTGLYGAAYSSDRLIQTQGLSEQDVNNVILGIASVGPNDAENQIIMLDPESRGVSWSLRIAAQNDSRVSAGFSHVAYWQSTLSAFRDLNTIIYFPFITDGNICKQLLLNEDEFNPSRWPICLREAVNKKNYQRQRAGGALSFPYEMLKKVACYILGKLETKSRRYLYILVPQEADYQAYCENVILQILSVIPVGLRKGITISTNPAQKDEENFGIIFQHEKNPARHGCDLSFHRAGNYEFLNDYYLRKNVAELIGLIADKPDITERCYREMEVPIYGDALPGSFVPYDSYYGISRLHVDKERPDYLNDCNTMLGQTKESPQQRQMAEKAIREEIGNSSVCLSLIERDQDYISSKDTEEINEYLKKRKDLIEYLNTIGIDFQSLFLYKTLEQICYRNNKSSAADVYEEIVRMREELTEVSESEKDKCCEIAWEKAWSEFEESIPPYKSLPPLGLDGKPLYDFDAVKQLLEDRNPLSGWSVSEATEQFNRLRRIAPVNPPTQMMMWYRRMQRVHALSGLYEVEESGDICDFDRQMVQKCLHSVFEHSTTDDSMQDSQEAEAALLCVQRIYASQLGCPRDPQTAYDVEKVLIEIHQICEKMYAVRSENEDRTAYEQALSYLMRLYLTGASKSSWYANAIEVFQSQILRDQERYQYDVCLAASQQIEDDKVSDIDKYEIYNAVKSLRNSSLHKVYESWVLSEFMGDAEDEQKMETLYASVVNPQTELKEVYQQWKYQKDNMHRIEDMIMTSTTFVRYLEAVIQRNGGGDKSENQKLRQIVWAQLTHEERDFSAYLGAVAFVTRKKNPVEFMLSDDRKGRILLNEFKQFADMQGSGMGLLLTEDETLQELNQRVLSFERLAGNSQQIPLYSLRNFEENSRVGFVEDKTGRTAAARRFWINDLVEVLMRVVNIQNDLFNENEVYKLTEELHYTDSEEIMDFMDRAGVFKQKDGLYEGFEKIGYRRKKIRSEKKGKGIRKCLPYIGWGVSAVLLVALLALLILGRKKTDSPKTTRTRRIPTSAESVSYEDDSSKETAESDLAEENYRKVRDRKPDIRPEGDESASQVLQPSDDNMSEGIVGQGNPEENETAGDNGDPENAENGPIEEEGQ